MLRIGIFFLLLLLSTVSWSQNQLQGVIKDSVNNKLLEATTISIYRQDNQQVEKVAISNKYGEFIFKDLPYGVSLRIELSHLRYQKLIQEIQLDKNEKKNLGKLYLLERTNLIDTVNLLAPVLMNGDTIEFYADAFKLDTNAVIEDLLYKLPGIMIWGDGQITYNGKVVPRVLVNGKPFFGDDKSIALQNIAKDAVEKLQLYDKRDAASRKENEMDANYEMNVVLKAGKEKMYFGNATIAFGNDDRNDGNLNVNYANDVIQSTIAFSANNTNKRLNSIDQLLKNTTFKGIGVRNDFSPDFFASGIQKQQIGGIRFQHDFLKSKDVNKSNIITAKTLYNNKRSILQDTATVEVFTDDGNKTNNSYYKNSNTSENTALNAELRHQYQKKVGNRMMDLNNSLTFLSTAKNDISSNIGRFDYNNNQSLNSANIENESKGEDVNLYFSANIGKRLEVLPNMAAAEAGYSLMDKIHFSIQGTVIMGNNDGIKRNSSNFENYLNSALNKSTNRIYDYNTSNNKVAIHTSIRTDNFIINYLIDHQTNKSSNYVKDEIYNELIEVPSLTHTSNYQSLKQESGAGYSIVLTNQNFVGRFQNNLKLLLKAGARWYNDHNNSSLDSRNIKQNYFTFLPEIRLDRFYNRNGYYTQNSSLSYTYDEIYPTLDKLRPFYDDINPSFRFYGGLNLRQYGRHQFQIQHNFRQQKKHGLTLNIGAKYNIETENWADSIRFEKNQERRFLTQNNSSLYSFEMNSNVERSFLLKQRQMLSVIFRGKASWRNGFQYLGDIAQDVVINEQQFSLNLHYSYDNKLVVGLISDFTRYQRNIEQKVQKSYQTNLINAGLSLSFAANRKLFFNTSSTNRLITANAGTKNVFIWNANVGYRISKGNNFEVKFSAYDLLRQNQSFYFENSPIAFKRGYHNNLNQYFMLSLSYFPRKFGM